jgi:hypothetical protein
VSVVSIVEGHAALASLPVLLRRLGIAAARRRCPSLDKLLRDLEGFGLIR